jgi:hypothetical protein
MTNATATEPEAKTNKKADNSTQRTTLQVESKSSKSSKESKGAIERYQRLPLPNNRPVGTTHLQISQTVSILGNRPVSATHIQIEQTFSASGIRPISKGEVEIKETFSASGVRPVGTTHLVIEETVMGRPVAANEDEENNGLMGFLD